MTCESEPTRYSFCHLSHTIYRWDLVGIYSMGSRTWEARQVLPGWEGPAGPSQMPPWTQLSLNRFGGHGLFCILPLLLLEWTRTPFQNSVDTIRKPLVVFFPSGFNFLLLKKKNKSAGAELLLFSECRLAVRVVTKHKYHGGEGIGGTSALGHRWGTTSRHCRPPCPVGGVSFAPRL